MAVQTCLALLLLVPNNWLLAATVTQVGLMSKTDEEFLLKEFLVKKQKAAPHHHTATTMSDCQFEVL